MRDRATWTPVGGASGGFTPALINMNEFGAPYANNGLASLPAGAAVAFEAVGGSPDDMGPWIGEAQEIRGVICIRKGSEVSLDQQVADSHAFNTKPNASGKFDIAYMQINNTEDSEGQKGEWLKLTTGGMEKISDWGLQKKIQFIQRSVLLLMK